MHFQTPYIVDTFKVGHYRGQRPKQSAERAETPSSFVITAGKVVHNITEKCSKVESVSIWAKGLNSFGARFGIGTRATTTFSTRGLVRLTRSVEAVKIWDRWERVGFQGHAPMSLITTSDWTGRLV